MKAGVKTVSCFYQEGTKDMVLEEVLKTEGVPYFRLDSIDSLTGIKALVLGEMLFTASQVSALKGFVKRGGILVAVKPDGRLSRAFGLEDTCRTQKNGYIILKGNTSYERVSYKGRLQVFGLAKLYTGGEIIVDLSPSHGYGGIIKSQLGEGIFFSIAYDVSTTFLTIQQPDSEVGRAYDTSRVETRLSHIPQLDLMRRLLINLVLDSIDVPLPRKWYFPGGHRALVLLGGDQDGADYRVMNIAKSIVMEYMVPYTLFTTPSFQPLSRAELREMAEGGMEIAVHPDFVEANRFFTEEEFKAQLEEAEGDAGVRIIGVRNHCVRWGSVVDMPVWMEKHGIQYDSDLGLRLPLDEPEAEPVRPGYFVGSGLPYFFIHPTSFRRINVLEEPLLASDDLFWMKRNRRLTVNDVPGVVKTFIAGMELSQEEVFQLVKEFMDDSLEKYHTVQCYCFHPVYLANGVSDICFKKIVKYARENGVLLLNQGEWNNYWRHRGEVEYESLIWDSGTSTLELVIRGKKKVKDMSFIVPLNIGEKKAKVFIDNNLMPYREENINEKQYALFTIDVGPEAVRITVSYT
jgi:hypothetical protein